MSIIKFHDMVIIFSFIGGPADLAGLKVEDKVLSVNGVSVVNVGHYDAVEVLKACGRVLVLVVQREVTRIVPPYEQVLFYETQIIYAVINIIFNRYRREKTQRALV